MSHEIPSNSYVDRVREDTQKYVRRLLSENEELRVTTAKLESEVAVLRQELAHRQNTERELQSSLERIRRESEQYFAQYAEVEMNNANLANLYVASYQLHGTLEREAVLGAIQEIIVNLIGSEEFAICGIGEKTLHVLAAVGVDAPIDWSLPRLDEVLTRRVLSVAPAGDRAPGEPLVCIPLQIDGNLIGAIVIFGLLAHKSQIEPLDHELFDLLATHASMALYCTTLHDQLAEARRAS